MGSLCVHLYLNNVSRILLLVLFCTVSGHSKRETLKSNEILTERKPDLYTAAVVEFHPFLSKNHVFNETIFNITLRWYLEIIQSTIERKLSSPSSRIDIIVFPEGTLNRDGPHTLVPDPATNTNLCNQNDTKYESFLHKLSCAAQKVRKYLVINLTEKESCDGKESSAKGDNCLKTYNTNVVFDRKGKLISRYRKFHLYVGEGNTTVEPEFSVFETDFGVKFGHFICYDILFYRPAQELVDKYRLSNIIFTSKFVSELPFLTAVQVQQGWAWGTNVTFLASGASYPIQGATGTGIYIGSSGLQRAVMNLNKGKQQLLIAQVPKNISNYSPSIELFSSQETFYTLPSTDDNRYGLHLLKDPRIEEFTSILLNLSDTNSLQTGQICSNDFCCWFTVKINGKDSYPQSDFYYRIGVFEGNRTYEKKDWNHIRVCGLYTCLNSTVASCGQLPLNTSGSVYQPNAVSLPEFERLTIEGLFEKAEQQLIWPSTLDKRLLPLSASVVNWSKDKAGDQYLVKMDLAEPTQHLLTFAIYANYYDGFPFTDNSNSNPPITSTTTSPPSPSLSSTLSTSACPLIALLIFSLLLFNSTFN